jgi:aromatic ring-opening dioxygenase catalytic subunit (LigB family)
MMCPGFSFSETPTIAADPDNSANELGLKFRSSVDGYVTGVRFYKGATNTGTHIGNLWSNGGTQLATATFTGESASGWQEVSFGSPVAMTDADFETPLGRVEIDQEIVDRLGRLVADDPLAHRYEHSIEVQLPFIQFFSDKAKFVPVAMAAQDYETAREVAEELAKACKGKDVVFVASTDFSHYVPAAEAKKQDQAVIDRILAMDAEGVHDTVVRKDVSMCGYGPVMAAMLASGGSHAKLLNYATSGDVVPMTEVVGYAAIAITRKA